MQKINFKFNFFPVTRQPVADPGDHCLDRGPTGSSSSSSMLAIELADYKNAVAQLRKELQQSKEALPGKESGRGEKSLADSFSSNLLFFCPQRRTAPGARAYGMLAYRKIEPPGIFGFFFVANFFMNSHSDLKSEVELFETEKNPRVEIHARAETEN
jgi:hypothetical protein